LIPTTDIPKPNRNVTGIPVLKSPGDLEQAAGDPPRTHFLGKHFISRGGKVRGALPSKATFTRQLTSEHSPKNQTVRLFFTAW
jgi:hypothetical protein